MALGCRTWVGSSLVTIGALVALVVLIGVAPALVLDVIDSFAAPFVAGG